MAIIACNPLVNNLSGMLGKTIVFKTLRGKTIMTNRPARPQKQSEQQRTNRSKFKKATAFAKAAMLHPDKKAYYWKKAKKLKLPNAYTAAITDYMRKPELMETPDSNGSVTYLVSKRDFELKKIEVIIIKEGKTETRVVEKDKYNEYVFGLSKEDLLAKVRISVTDVAGNILDLIPSRVIYPNP